MRQPAAKSAGKVATKIRLLLVGGRGGRVHARAFRRARPGTVTKPLPQALTIALPITRATRLCPALRTDTAVLLNAIRLFGRAVATTLLHRAASITITITVASGAGDTLRNDRDRSAAQHQCREEDSREWFDIHTIRLSFVTFFDFDFELSNAPIERFQRNRPQAHKSCMGRNVTVFLCRLLVSSSARQGSGPLPM